jgi:hypothetical protein
MCSGGKYCEEPGLEAVTGDCDDGYFCTQGSPYKSPHMGSSPQDYFGPCPPGHYCNIAEGGTTTPTECPIGTYSGTIFNLT